jgi:hypothetical protein
MRVPRVSTLLLLVLLLQVFLLLRSCPTAQPCPSQAQLPSLSSASLYGAVKRVGVLIVATGRYVQFIPQLLTDMSSHFLVGYNVTAVIFTEEARPVGCERYQCKVVSHKRYGWPYDTLLRWEGSILHLHIQASSQA